MSVNPAHLHLILNHFPVVLTAVAVYLLGLAVLTRRQGLGRAGLWTLIAAAVMAIPVFLAGEGAEDVVEELGVIHAFVEAHEASALLTLWTLIALGVGSGVGLWFYRRDRLPRTVVVAAFVLSLGAGWLVARTANLGGQIRHTEIRGELFAVPAEAREELEAERGAAGDAGEDERRNRGRGEPGSPDGGIR